MRPRRNVRTFMTKQPKRNAASNHNAPLSVLIIDDDDGQLYLLKDRLTREGFRVQTATDSHAGLALYATQHFDLVLVDHWLPGTPGTEVVRQLTSQDDAPPVIVLTAYSSEETAVNALRNGATDYIVKDVRGEYLRTLSARVMDVIAARDDDRRRRAAEIAAEVERHRADLLVTFIQKASHEFRTPLSLITTPLQYLQRVHKDDERTLKKLQSIETGSRQILQLVEALLLITSLETDDYLYPQHADLRNVVGSVIDQASRQIEAADLTVQTDFPAASVVRKVDVELLSRAFTELLDNAIRHSYAGGTIRVSMQVHDEGVVVLIDDEGSGIAPQHLPHIFEPLYRADSAHTTRGLGLGLPIAQGIIALHDGHLVIESVSGKGTRARVELSLAPSAHLTS